MKRTEKYSNSDLINFQNKPLMLFLTQRKYRFFRHFLFLFIFLFILYNRTISEYSEEHHIPILFIVYTFLVLMFYVNMYFLVPTYLMKGKYLLYVFILCLLDFLALIFISGALNTYLSAVGLPNKPISWPNLFESVILSVLLISTSTSIKLFQRWAIDTTRIAELHQLSLKLELNVLKSQINPHFLFNMLNNVKSLTRKNPELAGQVILRISDFLRHQIYGKNDESVSLASELEFISNFLNLEKIRRDNFQVNVDIDTGQEKMNTDNLYVPANLFTTFVENAIKHSVDPFGASSYIFIHFIISEQQMTFICRNSFVLDLVPAKADSGLGLLNIRRRLELLYQSHYSLNISHTTNEYCINLSVPL